MLNAFSRRLPGATVGARQGFAQCVLAPSAAPRSNLNMRRRPHLGAGPRNLRTASNLQSVPLES